MPLIGDAPRTRPQPTLVTRLRLTSGTREFVVPTAEIEFVVSVSGGHVRIHHGPRTYVAIGRLSEIAARIGASFVRANRSALVNIDRVRRCTQLADGTVALHFTGDSRVLVSGRYRMTVPLDRLVGVELS
jgi:DNA-binding LytR/AlgR family response regulator